MSTISEINSRHYACLLVSFKIWTTICVIWNMCLVSLTAPKELQEAE
jgi:hypothetical protein